MSASTDKKASRKGAALLFVGGLAIGVAALVTGLKRRPADAGLAGQFDVLAAPSGAFEVKVPAFLGRHYGVAKAVAGPGVFGARLGDPDRGNFLMMALSLPDAPPFEGGGFEPWLGDAYLECLATAESDKGRNWWALQVNEELQAQPFKMKYVVARNTIPLVSRVCVAGTNTLADVNVRVYGAMTGLNYERFAADVRAFMQSIRIDERRLRPLLNVRRAGP
ncbi:MAG: hypothetical protein SF187_00650 [Deltaproteobacteria bacterium]|nr:hypothetical protein [Deltaproteobacteria bacterium]